MFIYVCIYIYTFATRENSHSCLGTYETLAEFVNYSFCTSHNPSPLPRLFVGVNPDYIT